MLEAMQKCNDAPCHGLGNRLARGRQRTRFLSSSTSLCLCSKTAACHGRQRVQPRAGAAMAQRQQPVLLTWKGVFLRWTLNENESLPMITRPQARAAHARPPARQAGGTAASSGGVFISDCAKLALCSCFSADAQCSVRVEGASYGRACLSRGVLFEEYETTTLCSVQSNRLPRHWHSSGKTFTGQQAFVCFCRHEHISGTSTALTTSP